jgi:hypothetical protein
MSTHARRRLFAFFFVGFETGKVIFFEIEAFEDPNVDAPPPHENKIEKE